ncbi:hypothetical protein BH708_16020 [Brachybacterium sp. P6-10-X1]|nr:hypothetical protein BH708_16020 [Brachybacterium sp. P6-10-X1]
MADYNQMLVLDLIRRSAGISRGELVGRTGLTAQTMSNIFRRLGDEGMIRETGRVRGGSGSRRAVFEVVPSARYTVGLHIDPARLTVVMQDLAGAVVGDAVSPAPRTPDPASVLDLVETTIRSLLEDTSVPVELIAGIGVASPGPVDAAHGTVIDAPILPGWDVVELKKELELRFAIPVAVEKDNIAAVAGEVWKSSGEDENLAFIYLGSGVSAGLVLDGNIVRGAGINVGDIGHMSGDPNGPICQCGGRGCITATALPAVLVGEATGRGVLPVVDLGDAGAVENALTELCRLADEHSDSPAAEIIDRTARSFGRVCAQLANLLDLDTIVLGGPQWTALRPSFLRIIPSLVNRNYLGRTSHVVQVRGTSIGEHAGAVGAASLVMWETMFDPPKQLYIT